MSKLGIVACVVGLLAVVSPAQADIFTHMLAYGAGAGSCRSDLEALQGRVNVLAAENADLKRQLDELRNKEDKPVPVRSREKQRPATGQQDDFCASRIRGLYQKLDQYGRVIDSRSCP